MGVRPEAPSCVACPYLGAWIPVCRPKSGNLLTPVRPSSVLRVSSVRMTGSGGLVGILPGAERTEKQKGKMCGKKRDEHLA